MLQNAESCGSEAWDTWATIELVRKKLILWKSTETVPEAGPQNAAKRESLWAVPRRYPGGTQAVPGRYPRRYLRRDHRMLQNVGSWGGGTKARYPRPDHKMLQNVGSWGGNTEVVPGLYPGGTRGRTTECCKTWDPVSGTRAVPGRYPAGTRVGTTECCKTWDAGEAVPRRYLGGTRGSATEYCKTWDLVSGTRAVPGRYPRRDSRMLQNVGSCGRVPRRYPRRDHRMLQNVGSCGRRDVHPVWLLKI